MQPQSGIYKITNFIKNKVYIGQSKNVYKRCQQHFIALRRGYHENKEMQEDWNNDNRGFRFDVIELCPIGQLNDKEKYYIDLYHSMSPYGYNQTWVPYKRKQEKKKSGYKYKGYHRTVKK